MDWFLRILIMTKRIQCTNVSVDVNVKVEIIQVVLWNIMTKYVCSMLISLIVACSRLIY